MSEQQKRVRPAAPPEFLAPPRKYVPSMREAPETVERMREATSLCDEPEMVGERWLDRFGDDAEFYSAVRHAREVEEARRERIGVSHEQRVRTCRERAKRQHRTDLRQEIHRLELAVERAKRQAVLRLVEDERGFVRHEERTVNLPATAVARLERVEAKLDGVKDEESAA